MANTFAIGNILLALSLCVYMILHFVFDNQMSMKKRMFLMMPVMALVMYILSGMDWLMNIQGAYGMYYRELMWLFVEFMMVASMGCVTYLLGETKHAEGH